MVAKIRSLIDRLNEASRHYYGDGETIMTDKEYDDLYDRLVGLEKTTGIVYSDSPTVNVGSRTNSAFEKVRHEYPALSLNKTKDRDELREWVGGRVGVLSWKYDGITIILTYDGGKLIRAATRGDGAVGEDVTRNVALFDNIPLQIRDQRRIVIRGEAVIPYSTFNVINEKLPPERRYKNPRAMVAGVVKTVKVNRQTARGVHFVAFDVANAVELGYGTLSKTLDFVDGLGVETVERVIFNEDELLDIIAYSEERVSELGYPTDGLVVALDDLGQCKTLGSTRKYPRYAMAFKWGDKLETTILRAVEWSVAKTGLISPVAIFDPITLEGSTVRRANLHNVSVARDLQLGIGDRIRVYKANMIIPQVYDNLDKSDDFEIITKCPVCEEPIETRIGANGRSVFLYCNNEKCAARG